MIRLGLIALLTGAASSLECVSEDGDECAFSSLLLQTEKSINLHKPESGGRQEQKIQDIMESRRITNQQTLLSLDNASSTMHHMLKSIHGDHEFGLASELYLNVEKLLELRDALTLLVRTRELHDLQKSEKVGYAAQELTDAAGFLVKAQFILQNASSLLANQNLPSGEQVIESLASTRGNQSAGGKQPKPPSASILYGNYCGQGAPPPGCGKVENCDLVPVSPVDACCRQHDIEYSKLYPHARCMETTMEGDCVVYDNSVCSKFVRFDQDLAKCVENAGCPIIADAGCHKAKADIIALYSMSGGNSAVGETGCL